jgi:hypothetical protein
MMGVTFMDVYAHDVASNVAPRIFIPQLQDGLHFQQRHKSF